MSSRAVHAAAQRAAHPTKVARDTALLALEQLISCLDLYECRDEVAAAQLRAAVRLHGLLAERTNDRQQPADVLIAVALAQELGDIFAAAQPGVVEGVAKGPQLLLLLTWPLHERAALAQEVDHAHTALRHEKKQISRKVLTRDYLWPTSP